MACFEIEITDPGVKQERDTTDNDNIVMIHRIHQQKGTSDNEDNILMEEIKYEVTNNDDNDNRQISDNVESQNSQVLSNPQCINVYNDIFDIENDTQIDDVKFEILEILDNVEDVTSPSASDEGIPLRRLRSRKRAKLREDTKGVAAVKQRRPITSIHQCGDTDPAAALSNGATFSCPQCSYDTIYKYRLNKHSEIHTGKKFSCNKCDYKCIQKSYLKLHLLTHIGEKPFLCDKCDYKCNNKSNLNRHILSIHLGKKSFCLKLSSNKCSSRFF